MSDEIVEFSFFFQGTVYAASALSKDSVERLYLNLRKDDDHKHAFSDFPISKCKFYRLKLPVDLLGDENASLERSNLESINPNNTRISSLAGASKNFESNLVYLVIEPIKDPSTEAVDSLRTKYRDHVSSLTIELTDFLDWTEADVTKNLRGGKLLRYDHEDVPKDIREIQQRLARPRTYQGVENDPEFVIAKMVGADLFDRIFSAGASPNDCCVEDVMEFVAFHNILRCFHALVGTIRKASSSCKAGNFTVYFIQPPFFSDAHSDQFLSTMETPWKFPILLHSSGSNAWRKFTPRNDFMLYASKHSVPFLISEVMPQKEEEDQYRMLLEAIAAARIGNHLMEAGAKFFGIALYLDAEMIVTRYIVMQTGGDEEGSKDAVSISRRTFDLGKRQDAVEFVREMYNLVDELLELSRNLSRSGESLFSTINEGAKDIVTLHSSSLPVKSAAGTSLSTVEDSEEDERGGRTAERFASAEDWGDFHQNANEINAKLETMGYHFQCVIEGHRDVAVIRNDDTDCNGVLKFVNTKHEQEVRILQYLSEIESPSNYTISNINIWPVTGGTVISMPSAGRWITRHPHLEENLWSIASQLVEAVGFMHDHGVAHMDIKP